MQHSSVIGCCVKPQGPEAAAELPVVAEASKKSQLKSQVVGLVLAVYIGLANGSFTGGGCMTAVPSLTPRVGAHFSS